MKKIIGLFILLPLSLALFAQVAPDRYYVQFTDKNNTPYSIDNPDAYLSERAIERRTRQNIYITEQDFPVNPQYLQGVANVGVTLLNPSKWLNGVTIYTTDTLLLDQIYGLPYVEYVYKSTHYGADPKTRKPFLEAETIVAEQPVTANLKAVSAMDYGQAANQINMINGIPLHNNGYLGQGMVIAVLDAGWLGTDLHPAFDSLFANNQILGTKDFVDHSGTVYAYHTHGTSVLSTMAAYVPGIMIGTAPKADYWLLRSEESYGGTPENIIEEYNWVSAAEFADSVGADIINSSLGYTIFDDPQWDHTYEDMDGMTTVITRGADIAASKGILVVNSAGNSGNSSWYYIGAPADGFQVFSIGAVDPSGMIAGFSSHGPTYDGRIKPNVTAQGGPAYIALGFGGFDWGNGTSFSSPIIAGMSACLWQSHPLCSNLDLMESIQQSSSQHNDPDNNYGYGIPDYNLANNLLHVTENETTAKLSIFPNPVGGDVVNLSYQVVQTGNVLIQVIDQTGRLVRTYQSEVSETGMQIFRLDRISSLSKGVYMIRIREGDRTVSGKFSK